MYYKLLFKKKKKSSLQQISLPKRRAQALSVFCSSTAAPQFEKWEVSEAPGVGAPLNGPFSGKQGTMEGPVRPRNRLTSLVAEFRQGLGREKTQGRPVARARAHGGVCVLGPGPYRRAPPKGE